MGGRWWATLGLAIVVALWLGGLAAYAKASLLLDVASPISIFIVMFFFMLDEHRAYFSIGDVCGKGIPASLFMVISKTLCKSLALRFSSFALTQLDPGYLMRQANLEISRDNTEMFFVTAIIGVFDLRTGELSHCNAGHDMPLRFTPGSQPTELGGGSSPPICVVDEYDYQTYRTRLAPGEFLCLFTDGVTEAFNAKQEMYGRARLNASLGECGQGATAQDVLEGLCARVHEFESGADPSDDLTAMVLRWTPDPRA